MVHPWHDLPSRPDSQEDLVNVVIEIPKGSKVKYELDKPSGMLRVDRVLHSSVHYPANYGFIPRSYADDGDPLDVLVLSSEPVAPMSIVIGRPIGLLRMEDGGKLDDKVVAVHADDPAFTDYRDIFELPKHLALEMGRFLKDYKKNENKTVSVDDPIGGEHALRVIGEAIELYRREENKLRGWS